MYEPVLEAKLVASIRDRRKEIEKMVEELRDDIEYSVYRFYHGSFKTYHIQNKTIKAFALLLDLDPREGSVSIKTELVDIVYQGTGIEFKTEHNGRWLEVTGPILTTAFHVLHVLEMMLKHGLPEKVAGGFLEEGWGTVLYQYGMR